MINKKSLILLILCAIFSICYGGNNNYANKRLSKGGLLKTSYSETHHLFGVYADGGYSMMYHNNRSLDFIPQGHSESLGIIYEFQQSMFCLQLGVGIRNQKLSSPFDDYSISSVQQDSWGYTYTLNHQFTERNDNASMLYLQVPLMFGLAYNGFYSLLGIKYNQPITGRTHITATCNVWGEYSQYIGVFEEHDNHGFRKDLQIDQHNGKLSLRPDILLAAEIGYDYNSYLHHHTTFSNLNYRLRIAAFVDYGIVNINSNTNLPICYIPTNYIYDIPSYQLNHIYSTNLVFNSRVRNLFAGIKLTVLIGFRNNERCVTCDKATRYF